MSKDKRRLVGLDGRAATARWPALVALPLLACSLASEAGGTPPDPELGDLERWLGKRLTTANVELSKPPPGLKPPPAPPAVDRLICSLETYVRITREQLEEISRRVHLTIFWGRRGTLEFPDGSRYRWDNRSLFLSVENLEDGSDILLAPCPWVRDDCDLTRCNRFLPDTGEGARW